MVPNNKSTPKPLTVAPFTQTHQPSSSSSSSALQFPSLLLLPLMTRINPNLSPRSQPHPNSNSPLPVTLPPSNPNLGFAQCPIIDLTSESDHPRELTRDSDAGNGNGIVDTEIADVAHWVHQQIGTGVGVSDQHIDNFVTHFFNDPNAELRPLGHHGSTTLDLNERGKRGIDFANLQHLNTDDYLGTSLSMDDHSTAKRSRKTENEDNGNHDFGAVKLGFEYERHNLSDSARRINGSEFGGSISAEEVDQRGKRKLGDSSSSEEVDDDNGSVGMRRFTREEKRKEPLVEIDFLSNVFHEAELALESHNNRNLDIDHLADNVAHQQVIDLRRNRYMERFREIAKENASRFACFAPEPDVTDDGSSPEPGVEHEIDDCSTPFSTAMKIIKDRGMKRMQTGSWVPKRNQGARFSVPSLQELCLKILADNADAIVSLDGVPDDLRHRLSQLLCDSRKMNNHFFELLVSGSPTEIRLRDCSWLSEEQFTKSFQTCDTAYLEVLQLDQCGRCIPDYALLATLAQSPWWLPRLTSLSLRGACRLSDKGLHVLVSSAPVLRSINLSQCSLLTSASLNILADSLGSLLKELYLDDCQNINAALIVPALKELEHLEVLSLAGIQSVCDEFIKDYIIARGHNMKELVLKDCIKLTDASVKVIAEHCPGLCELDLMNLCKLTDLSIGYLANSCRALHTLKLCRNPFSDEAIAAFMEITGESLKELSLNNIRKVGHHTTLSLASHGKNLHTLDLSWCRNLTDNELGLIVDSCFSLRLLKLFGCTQVADVFLDGHSKPEIQIIGLKMSPLLQHVKMPDPHQGALRYSSVSVNLNQK